MQNILYLRSGEKAFTISNPKNYVCNKMCFAYILIMVVTINIAFPKENNKDNSTVNSPASEN